MISYGSRYTDSELATLTVSGQPRQVIVPGPQRNFTVTYASHQVTGEERVDTIAQRFYKDPSQWWQFADANPEILDWTALAAGTIIRVPGI